MIKKHKRYLICVICVICAIIGFAVRYKLIHSVSMQYPEKRWSADKETFSYVAAYFPETAGIGADQIKGYESEHVTALKEASFEEKEDARLFVDAYSFETILEITRDVNPRSSFSVNVTAVGGDFFYFHPMQLLSGNYISEYKNTDGSYVMDDLVVLDDYTAWLLYGSSDVAGKSVLINGNRFFISGVVKPDPGKAAKKTYGKKSRIYMSASAYLRISGEETPEAITTYEMVYPDPITNFAYNQLKKDVGIGDESGSEEEKDESGVEVVNFSTRYKYMNLWKVIKDYGSRSSKTNGIIYPFWENEARRIEDFAALAQLIATVFAIAGAVTLFPDIKRLYKKVYNWVSALIGKYRQKFS